MRLFVAVWPPEDVVEQLKAIPRPEIKGLRWATPEQWHVTLRFLGNVEEPQRVIDVLQVLEGFGTVTATVGPSTRRFGRDVLYLPVSGLDHLAKAVFEATKGIIPSDEFRFTGHLTLARSTKGVDMTTLLNQQFSMSWLASEVNVVSSATAQTGASYEVLSATGLS